MYLKNKKEFNSISSFKNIINKEIKSSNPDLFVNTAVGRMADNGG